MQAARLHVCTSYKKENALDDNKRDLNDCQETRTIKLKVNKMIFEAKRPIGHTFHKTIRSTHMYFCPVPGTRTMPNVALGSQCGSNCTSAVPAFLAFHDD